MTRKKLKLIFFVGAKRNNFKNKNYSHEKKNIENGKLKKHFLHCKKKAVAKRVKIIHGLSPHVHE